MTKKLLTKKKMIVTLIVSLLATIFIGSQLVQMNQDENKISAANVDWKKYLKTGDIKQDVSFTYNNGSTVPPGATLKQGDTFRIQYNLNLQGGSGLKPGDTMTFPLPSPMKIINNMNEAVRDGQGGIIGYMKASPGATSFVFELTNPAGVGNVVLNVWSGFSTSGDNISLVLDGKQLWSGKVEEGNSGGDGTVVWPGDPKVGYKNTYQMEDGTTKEKYVGNDVLIGTDTVSKALGGAPMTKFEATDTVSTNQWFTNPIRNISIRFRYNDGENREIMYEKKDIISFVTYKDEFSPGKYRTFVFDIKGFFASKGYDLANLNSWKEIAIFYHNEVDQSIVNKEEFSNSIKVDLGAGDQLGWTAVKEWSRGDGSGERVLGNVKLVKTDDKDQSGSALAGAEFSLYRESGTLVESGLRIGSDGTLTVPNLAVGNYYFVETKAPAGFEHPVAGNRHPFEITGSNAVNNITIEKRVANKRIPDRDFTFKKVSQGTSTGLQAGFILQRQNGANWVDVSTEIYRTNATTGVLSFNEAKLKSLGEGTYRFREVEAANGHQLPTGNAVYSGTFKVNTYDVTPTSVTMSNVRINRSFSFLKQSASGNKALPGAQFTLQKKNGTTWSDVSATRYTTGADGKISFTEAQLNAFGEGTYRLREVQAPADHDLPEGNAAYSPEFVIEREKVTPASLSMVNAVTNHRLELSKTGEDTGATLLQGAEFIIQGKKADGKWHQVGTQTFTTGANGKIIVDNTTAPGLIKEMLTSSDYTAYRFRETKAPRAWYQDPQYKAGAEAAGNPGDKFSVPIDLAPLRTAVRSTTLTYTLKNDLLRYQASIQKIDKLNHNLAGAEFTMWNEKTPTNKQTNKGNATGLFTWQDLVIGETYVITETKAPAGYGLQSYHYFLSMDKNTQTIKVERSETLTGTRMPLVAGRDYKWDQGTLALSFTVVNNKVREMPKTGGVDIGLYGYLALGVSMIGLGYMSQTIYKKKRSN